VTAEIETLIDPSGATAETFDATVPIVHSPNIAYIIKLSKVHEESTMVEYIDQQGWTELRTFIQSEMTTSHISQRQC
jgi:hypothetical protein